MALGLVGVSVSAVLVRLADAPVSAIAFWRLTLSLLLILPLLGLSGQWREVGSLGRSEWRWVVLSGGALALHFVTWFLSLEYTSVASSTVLVTAHPLYVGLLSTLWLREPPSRLEWVAILVATSGAVWIGWGDFHLGEGAFVGDLLAALAAFFAALYFISGRRLRLRLALWSYVAPVYLLAALLTGVSMWVRGVPAVGYSPANWVLFAGMAIGPMLFGHTSFNWALRHVRAYVVSLVVLLEPVGATVLAVLVLGAAERPSMNTVTGGIAILIGMAMLVREQARRSSTRPPLSHSTTNDHNG
ncbi:MAG: DMT family transporter [Gemmatimonadales bacterium]|jgi:drug/metabolite transporter (DMT)-like permease